jgi:hypothetical protein
MRRDFTNEDNHVLNLISFHASIIIENLTTPEIITFDQLYFRAKVSLNLEQ